MEHLEVGETGEGYERDEEHSFEPGEPDVWRRFIAINASSLIGSNVLDIGCGTGLFSYLLAEWGCSVVGIDSDDEQIAYARGKLGSCKAAVLPCFRKGWMEAPDILGSDRFDWIVSRQAICYLRDPVSSFMNWARWLKPSGGVFLVDGYWPTTSWENAPPPLPPYASISSPKAIADDLTAAGLQIRLARDFEEVNEFRKRTIPSGRARYVAIAKQPE